MNGHCTAANATPSRQTQTPQLGHDAIESSHATPEGIPRLGTLASHEPPSAAAPTPHSESQPTQALALPQAGPPVATTTTTTGTASAAAAAGTAGPGLPHFQSPPSQPDSSSPLAPSSLLAANEKLSSSSSKMRYKSPRSTLSKFYRPSQPLALTQAAEHDPDLWSKDKGKQKEAVKKHLAEKVRNDWEFIWPQPPQPPHHPPSPTLEPVVDHPEPPVSSSGPSTATPATPATLAVEPESAHPTDTELDDHHIDPDSDAESVYSTLSEDPVHFRPRLEWASDLSDDDDVRPRSSLSPFRFDSPDAVGSAVKASVIEKRAQRRRALREEMRWNDGLACFEARRDAWTGAKTVRVRPKFPSPPSPLTPLSPRRLFRRSSMSTSPIHVHPVPSLPLPLQQRRSNDTSAAASDGSEALKDNELTSHRTKDSSQSTATTSAASTANLPVETLLPIPPPILPPRNPMRASITPAIYISLYEKVIVHNLTPSCPVNLADMIRASVAGWKRDGEWPPKPSAVDPTSVVAVRKKKRLSVASAEKRTASRRMSLGFLTRGEKASPETEETTSPARGIRRSLQRVLGLGHPPPSSPTAVVTPPPATRPPP